MQSGHPARAGFVLLLAVAGASGCAAKGEAAGARSPAAPEPSTVEEAQSQLESARQQLEGGSSAGAGAPSGAAVQSTPMAPLSEAPSPPADAAAQNAGGDACATACRAIASMRHAVDAICRIAGPQDTSCVAARKTLSDDEARVARCGCAQ